MKESRFYISVAGPWHFLPPMEMQSWILQVFPPEGIKGKFL